MSRNYQKFKEYYEKGFISDAMLQNLIGKKFGITQEEYDEITKEKNDTD